jgi:PAS domain S-box-containing protein
MTMDELQEENAELHRRLEEAEETLRAIQDGAVDAFVVQDKEGSRIYTLEGAEHPYRMLIEQMQQGAATLSADGTIVYCNLRLAELLRVPHEKLIGAPLRSFIAPNQRGRFQALQHENAETSQGEVQIQRADGTLFPAYLTFNALQDCNAATGVLITDLTAQKRQVELAAAHEVLKETNRLKDDFLATLSHELRTPLNAILGWTHMLSECNLSEDTAQRALQAITRNAKAQAQLVEDLFDVSRIVSNKLQLKADTVDLTAVIASAAETVFLSAKAKQIALNVRIDSDAVLFVRGDAERLQQVVWNLLSNSIKFTPADGRIEVELRRKDATAEILIRDTGQGIGPDFLPHVFERFQQAESTSTRNAGGLGLGLAIVRYLTEAHGGTVTAESAGVGQGATFAVRLPILETNPRMASTTIEAHAASTLTDARSGG